MHRNISINVLSLPPAAFHQHVETIARVGAEAMTPDIGQMAGIGAVQAARLMNAAGVRAAALTHRSFGYSDSAEMRAARDRLAQSIEFAGVIGASSIVLTTGGRGGLTWRDAAHRFADSIAPCAVMAQQAGVSLGIEPTSHLYADASIAYRLDDCVALARLADIAVVIDLFACWNDPDIETAIAVAGSLTSMVQVSDYVYGDRSLPCRAVPGDGAIPLDRLLPAIVRAGFSGYFDLEIIGPRLQAQGVEVGLRRAADTVSSLLSMAGLT